MIGGQLYGPEKKEEKGCRKTARNQNQHDTYVIKIMTRQRQTKMTEGQLYGPEKKEEKGCRKIVGNKNQHDTYVIKIKKNIITINISSINVEVSQFEDHQKKSITFFVSEVCNGILSFP